MHRFVPHLSSEDRGATCAHHQGPVGAEDVVVGDVVSFRHSACWAEPEGRFGLRRMPSNRRRGDSDDTIMVRLTQKLAAAIDGIDLTGYNLGEIITLPARSARLLIAEGWAEAIDEERRRSSPRVRLPRLEAPRAK